MKKNEMLDTIQRNGQRKSGIGCRNNEQSETGMPCRAMEEEMPACNAGGMDGEPALDAGITDEALREVLVRLQWMRMVTKGMPRDAYWCLVSEDRDWLVIMQCMQDCGVFLSRPERPPFKEFVDWMQSVQVPQLLTECKADTLSRAYCKLGGARYPWKHSGVQEHILLRWRVLYQMLDKMLTELP